MENYKVTGISILDVQQVNLLNSLGFKVPSFIRNYQPVKENDGYFEKSYEMCGGVIILAIRIHKYYLGDNLYDNFVNIKTPRDSWWGDFWNIKDFTTEIDSFMRQLYSDLRALELSGIIEKDIESDGE